LLSAFFLLTGTIDISSINAALMIMSLMKIYST
jgi:hypothetical protein